MKEKNNVIICKTGGIIRNTIFSIKGNNNRIEIEEGVSIKDGSICIEDNNNLIKIGKNSSLYGKIHLACLEGTKIEIGEDCLFSSDIVFRTSDLHSLLNLDGERINKAEDIYIGNHVWIGHKVCINKGTYVSDNSMIGTGAVVTKKYMDSNVVIVGVPAKVVKQGITWRRERI